MSNQQQPASQQAPQQNPQQAPPQQQFQQQFQQQPAQYQQYQQPPQQAPQQYQQAPPQQAPQQAPQQFQQQPPQHPPQQYQQQQYQAPQQQPPQYQQFIDPVTGYPVPASQHGAVPIQQYQQQQPPQQQFSSYEAMQQNQQQQQQQDQSVDAIAQAVLFDKGFDEIIKAGEGLFVSAADKMRAPLNGLQLDQTQVNHALKCVAVQDFFGVEKNLSVLSGSDQEWLKANVIGKPDISIDSGKAWQILENALHISARLKQHSDFTGADAGGNGAKSANLDKFLHRARAKGAGQSPKDFEEQAA